MKSTVFTKLFGWILSIHSHYSAIGTLCTIWLVTQCIPSHRLYAQEIDWQTDVEYALDNAEYHQSGVATSRTYHLVILRPIIGLKWAPDQSVYIGTHVRKNAGSSTFIDQIEPTIYYDYSGAYLQFRAGIFPRADVLPQYWTQFYNSSFRSYNAPQMFGAFIQYGQPKKSFVNLWVDWRSLQSNSQREEMIFGSAANYDYRWLFADYQAYLHRIGPSKKDEKDEIRNIQDQLLLQATVGARISNTSKTLKGFAAVGFLLAHEANHLVTDQRHTQIGFIGRFNLEYCGIGTRNLTYWGQPQQTLLDEVGSDLYLGSQFLRRPFYHRNDLFINILQTSQGKLELSSIQHISGGRVFFQHTLALKMQLDPSLFNKKKETRGSNIFPWMKIFK